MTEEDIIRLKFEILGDAGIAAASSKLGLMKGSMDQLIEQFRTGALSETDFELHALSLGRAIDKLAKEVKIGTDAQHQMAAAAAQVTVDTYEFADACTVLTAKLDRAASVEDEAAAHARAMEAALSDVGAKASTAAGGIDKVNGVIPRVTRQMKDAKAGSSGLATTLTQLSYAADDMQYGFRGLSNNIAPLLSQFGVYGSVVAIGAVGTYQIAQNWRYLTAAFRTDLIDQKADQVETLTKRIEELKKETKLTKDETLELANAQEALSAKKAALAFSGGSTNQADDIKKMAGDFQKSGQGELLKNAINDALRRPLGTGAAGDLIKEAIGNGQLKGVDVTQLGNADYLQKAKARWLNEVLPGLRDRMLERLSKEGDSSAVDELADMLSKTGQHDTGPIAELVKDLQNAQSGLPRQKEIEAIGRKNAREGDKRRKEEEEKRDKEEAEARQNREREENQLQEKNAPNKLQKQDEAREKEAENKKNDQAEADRVRQEIEGNIDKTGVQGAAFGMFNQIVGMKGQQRRNANAEADAMIQQMVAAQAQAMGADVNGIEAQQMIRDAPAYFRRLFAEQMQKQQMIQQNGQGGGNGFNSVGVEAPIVGNQGDLAANQRGIVNSQITQTNEIIQVKQDIASVKNQLGVLHQRQRTMQLRGR